MFATSLCLTALTPDLWSIDQPLTWIGDEGPIVVPKGFITDLASIPRVLRNLPLLDVDGLSRRPAALHDWLYAGYRHKGKAFADQTLRAALIAEGMTHAGASIYYYGVHWFGAGGWNFDAMRHPYVNVNQANPTPSNLESFDFVTEADWQAWLATSPEPNER
jgi:hypothetical protein